MRDVIVHPILRGTIPSPGTPGEGRVRVHALDVIESVNVNRAEPSPQSSPGVPGEEARGLNDD